MNQENPGILAILGALFTAIGGVLTVIVTKLLDQRRDLGMKEVDRIDARDTRVWNHMEKRLTTQDAEIIELEARVDHLLAKNEILTKDKMDLAAQVARLQEENGRMSAENAIMREKIKKFSSKLEGDNK